jgi:DNA-binding GntR family transcriptional regulator
VTREANPKGDTRLRPLQHESLVELAYRSVRESILSGRFAMGDRLIETRIAEDLGVSRAPVREALRRLREEQLVIELPRRGSVVRSFDGDDLVHIYNLRIIVESGAVRLAVRNGASTAPLQAQIDRMARAAQRADAPGVSDAEFAFHEALIDAADNPYLATVFRNLSAQIQIALALDNSTYDLASVADEHLPIVERIAAGDEDGAVRELRRHILSTVDGALEKLGGVSARLLAFDDDLP